MLYIYIKNVYPRERYLSKIRPFYHSDIIKVTTGIRRCGKSFILNAIMNELFSEGIVSYLNKLKVYF